MKYKTKKTWKSILAVGLVLVAAVGAVFGVSALVKKNEETTKEIHPKFEIGGLTEEGKYLETKESIYTKDMFECQGLTVKMAFDNDISYRLYFYNENNLFIESTEKLTDVFDSSKTNMPEDTKYCRVVITPNEDSEISWYEKSGYAKQLTIKVNKDQTKSDGVFVPVNLFEVDESMIYQFPSNCDVGKTFSTVMNENGGLGCCVKIDVRNISKLRIDYSKVDTEGGVFPSYFLDESDTILSKPSSNLSKGSITDLDVPEDAVYFRMFYDLQNEPSIFAIG